MADETKKYLDYEGLAHLVEKLENKIASAGGGGGDGGDYLPLSGGTLTGDLKVGGTTVQASDGHIILPSGVEIY